MGADSAEAVENRIRESAQAAWENGLGRLEFRAMSSICRVTCHGAPADAVRDFQAHVLEWVARFEARLSRFLPDSLLSQINAAAGRDWVEVDEETDRILSLCQEFFCVTHGAFDPTALPLMRLWNWKAQPPTLPDAETIRATLELVGWDRVRRRAGAIFLPTSGMAIDLGGVGKEYAVDHVLSLAIRWGIPNVLVDFGQDVRARGHAPGRAFWAVGLEDAASPGRHWARVAITDHAVATSGDYQRHFEIQGRRYGHIIDPRTGYPASNNCRTASVVAPSCAVAGLLSTGVCVLGAEEGLRLIELYAGAEGAIVTDTDRLCSKGFLRYVPE